ncbi:ADP-ribose diphosphatase, partial [Bacillus thuringiensis]|nr:ADP-ribose diphosphatase [Bacillus thuringiensis]
MEENIVLCEDVLVEVIKIFEIEGIVNMLLEMVVGMIEVGEMVEDVVCWEVLEEVGFEVGWMKLILSYLVSFGGISEWLLILVGEVDVLMVKGIYGLVEENED